MGEGNILDADGQFENCPYVNFNDGQLKFDTNWFDNANDNYGSASGFFPKSVLTMAKGILVGALSLFLVEKLLTRGGGDNCLHPAAEHTTNFIYLRFERYIPFRINGLDIFS